MKQIKCSECKKEYDSNLKNCPHCGYENKSKKILNYSLYLITVILFIVSILSIIRYIAINNYLRGLNNYVVERVNTQYADNLNEVTEAYSTGEYIEKYGSIAYGKVAYTLNNIKIWSMSVCIGFIWIGIYIKRKNIKSGNLIKYVAIVIFIIFQLLPLGYAIAIKNTRTSNTNIINQSNENQKLHILEE